MLLENGLPIAPTVVDRLAVLHTVRAELHHPWREGPSPHERAVTQVQGWLFAPDGRVLVLLEPETGTACLPGGVPEPQDQGDPASTLCREAVRHAAAPLGTPLSLGHLTDPRTRHTHLRYAARFTDTGAPPADPDTGRSHTRILATPEQATQLFDGGEQTTAQLAAVHRGRRRLRPTHGLSPARHRTPWPHPADLYPLPTRSTGQRSINHRPCSPSPITELPAGGFGLAPAPYQRAPATIGTADGRLAPEL
ncbi:hypothetical protein [Streptomyces sp. NPDC088146]|uniref:hypothetical protein n=1 Tax=Streptomyces sp. NPDC088146 TaxID=3365829 RepID=UPI0038027083